MPSPQELLGKYINYRVDPGGTMNPGPEGTKVNRILNGQTTPATVAVYANHATGAPRAPSGTLQKLNVPWSFTFLKYVAGAVTIVPLHSAVLTGPMSGCYLCKYAQNGQEHLAHIGTANSPDSVESVEVKAAWRGLVAGNDVSQVSGGSPFEEFTTGEFKAAMQPQAGVPLVVGYFSGGAAYAMLLAPMPPAMQPTPLLKVAGVKKMTLKPWATLAAMPRFRG